MTSLIPTQQLNTQNAPRYALIPLMDGRKVLNLYRYLHDCNDKYPASIMTEYWDMGIGHCKERLIELGYKFLTLRAGYASQIIQGPDGKTITASSC